MTTVNELKEKRRALETEIRNIDFLIENIQEKCDHDFHSTMETSIDYFAEQCSICDKMRWV